MSTQSPSAIDDILADLDANEVPESNGQEAFDVKIA